MAGHPLRPATRRRLGGPLPRQLADRPRDPPSAQPCGCFLHSGMSPNDRTRYYPAVGPAIPRRWTGFSRVTHPSATELESCPPSPVRLTCVRHAASVRPEPGSNSPMIGKFEQLTERLWYFCRPNHNQNETPRGALLTTHPLKWGRTPHTRSSILKELLAKKVRKERRILPAPPA